MARKISSADMFAEAATKNIQIVNLDDNGEVIEQDKNEPKEVAKEDTKVVKEKPKQTPKKKEEPKSVKQESKAEQKEPKVLPKTEEEDTQEKIYTVRLSDINNVYLDKKSRQLKVTKAEFFTAVVVFFKDKNKKIESVNVEKTKYANSRSISLGCKYIDMIDEFSDKLLLSKVDTVNYIFDFYRENDKNSPI